jgi:hypothetical protein
MKLLSIASGCLSGGLRSVGAGGRARRRRSAALQRNDGASVFSSFLLLRSVT